jgi:predicted ATPase
MSPAIDAAFCSAVRVTLVGSRIPNSIVSRIRHLPRLLGDDQQRLASLTAFSKRCISGSSAKTRSFIRSQKKFDGVVSQPRLH